MGPLQQAYLEASCSDLWADPDPKKCACRGGWFLSDLDTQHKCPFHYTGQPGPHDDPADEDEWDDFVDLSEDGDDFVDPDEEFLSRIPPLTEEDYNGPQEEEEEEEEEDNPLNLDPASPTTREAFVDARALLLDRGKVKGFKNDPIGVEKFNELFDEALIEEFKKGAKDKRDAQIRVIRRVLAAAGRILQEDGVEEDDLEPCHRCGGTGLMPYPHVQGGICFRCHGLKVEK